MTHNTTQPTHPKYRADIDGLRAIAVLAVIGFHAFPKIMPGGFIGVDVFFVISGFLISTIILSNLDNNRFSIIDFYSRRIKRIFPALLTVMMAGFVFGWFSLLANEYKQLGMHIAGGSAFFSNFLLLKESGYFDNAAASKPLLHLWSLAIEEQFYIFWPPLLMFVWKRHWSFLRITACIAVASFAANIYLIGQNPAAAFYLPFSRVWELMIGGVGAYIALHRPEQNRQYKHAKSIFGFALLALGLILISKARSFPGWWATLPALGTYFILSAGSNAWLNRKILSNKFLVWIGLISYPLYLWHWSLLSFAYIIKNTLSVEIRASLVTASALLAWLTYKFIEKPIRFGGHRQSKIAALLVLMCLLGCSGYFFYYNDGYPYRNIIGMARKPLTNENQSLTSETLNGPINSETGLSDIVSKCHQRMINQDAEYKIILWGDSHAESWVPVLEEIAIKNNYGLIVIWSSGCPPIEGIRRTDGGAKLSICNNLDANRIILNDIIKLKPNLVILTARWSLYSNGWFIKGDLQQDHHFLTSEPIGDADEKTSKLALSLKIPSTINTLAENNIKVIVFKNPPVLKDTITNYRKSLNELEPTIVEHENLSKFTDLIFKSMKNLTVFDPAEKLCESSCKSFADGEYLYWDDNHLSYFGARYFQQEIETIIKNAIPQ